MQFQGYPYTPDITVLTFAANIHKISPGDLGSLFSTTRARQTMQLVIDRAVSNSLENGKTLDQVITQMMEQPSFWKATVDYPISGFSLKVAPTTFAAHSYKGKLADMLADWISNHPDGRIRSMPLDKIRYFEEQAADAPKFTNLLTREKTTDAAMLLRSQNRGRYSAFVPTNGTIQYLLTQFGSEEVDPSSLDTKTLQIPEQAFVRFGYFDFSSPATIVHPKHVNELEKGELVHRAAKRYDKSKSLGEGYGVIYLCDALGNDIVDSIGIVRFKKSGFSLGFVTQTIARKEGGQLAETRQYSWFDHIHLENETRKLSRGYYIPRQIEEGISYIYRIEKDLNYARGKKRLIATNTQAYGSLSLPKLDARALADFLNMRYNEVKKEIGNAQKLISQNVDQRHQQIYRSFLDCKV